MYIQDWSEQDKQALLMAITEACIYEPIDVWAVGSYVYGNPRPDSDIDIVVHVDNNTRTKQSHTNIVWRDTAVNIRYKNIKDKTDLVLGCLLSHYSLTTGEYVPGDKEQEQQFIIKTKKYADNT